MPVKQYCKGVVATLFLFVCAGAGAQSTASAGEGFFTKPSFEPGLGMVFRHHEKFAAPRLVLGVNQLIKNRVGFYYTLEYRGGIHFEEDNTHFYFRDLFGVSLQINEQFSIHGGAGLLRKGLLLGASRVDPRLRKEIAIKYKLKQYPWTVNLGYSNWVGPTLTIGYVTSGDGMDFRNTRNRRDRDGDGVADKEDLCPTVPGIAANKGCPEVIIVPEVEIAPEVIVVPEVLIVPEVVAPEVVKELEEVLDTSDINFEFGKALLMPSSSVALDKLVAFMMSHDKLNIEVRGYTDSIGSNEYNIKLGQNRAQSIKSYLVYHGIIASRITTISYGEKKPLIENTSASGRAKNRRANFRISN